jgi:hypothetical protein
LLVRAGDLLLEGGLMLRTVAIGFVVGLIWGGVGYVVALLSLVLPA